jgi:DNA repair protein RadA/Sms
LVGGDPGVGKSTLMTQIALSTGLSFYLSGEESMDQIRMRASRVTSKDPSGMFLFSTSHLEQGLESILRSTDQITSNPWFVIIDSIQTMRVHSAPGLPGGVVQLRESVGIATSFAKKHQIPIFLVAHITKTGQIAGPKMVEHLVDVVLYFEGESSTDLRILRSMKNRFGPTNEIGVFEMRETGLQEVIDPSERFYDSNSVYPGNTIVVALEGTTPLVVELQSLVTQSPYSVPKRVSKGIDMERLSLMCAVLSKRLNIPVDRNDVYVNLLGGLRIDDPAIELGLAVSIYSSFVDQSLPNLVAFFGEVGLDGKIRRVANPIKRIRELERLQFLKVYTPVLSKDQIQSLRETKLEIIQKDHLVDVLTELMNQEPTRT